jgi:ElaB/YqjD/DUF883 family membrane-anchored ribosome-binding protein
MTQPVSQVTRDQLIDGFNTVVSDTEQLLKSVTTAGGEKAGALRVSVEQSLALAKERLLTLQQSAKEGTQAAARATDEYVHLHPWQAIGIAAGFSLVLGAAIGFALNRR